MKDTPKVNIKFNREWFVYLSAVLLFFLLAFLSSCNHHANFKTANRNKVKDIIQKVLDKDYELIEKQSLQLTPIHFTTGNDELLKNELPILKSNSVWLKNNPQAVIVLEGHCDERGWDHYNMELGDRRAREVKTHLMENDIDADRLIMVVSYGERKPLDPRHTPIAWKTNRRVEFIIR